MLVSVKRLITTSLVTMFALAPISAGDIVLAADPALVDATNSSTKKSRAAFANRLKNLNATKLPKIGQGYIFASATGDIANIATYGIAQIALRDAQLAYSAYVDTLFPEQSYAFVKTSGIDCANTLAGAGDAECSTISAYEGFLAELQGTIDNAAFAASLAFAQIGGNAVGAPGQEYINTLFGFGGFSSPRPADREISEIEGAERDLGRASLTF